MLPIMVPASAECAFAAVGASSCRQGDQHAAEDRDAEESRACSLQPHTQGLLPDTLHGMQIMHPDLAEKVLLALVFSGSKNRTRLS